MSNRKIVALRISGVMQSWGFDSEYTYRNSGLYPTKSGILGLCCAAKGLPRGSEQETEFLAAMSNSLMTAVAIPRVVHGQKGSRWLHVKRIEDFQTVENTKTASGKVNANAVMTYRQFLCDAEFLVLLEVDTPLAGVLSEHLEDPKWGVWFGRKSCIPSAPVLAGVFDSLAEIEDALLQGRSFSDYSYQKEVDAFTEGVDCIRDVPLNFGISSRKYCQRRLVVHEREVERVEPV